MLLPDVDGRPPKHVGRNTVYIYIYIYIYIYTLFICKQLTFDLHGLVQNVIRMVTYFATCGFSHERAVTRPTPSIGLRDIVRC